MTTNKPLTERELTTLQKKIENWALALGFQQLGFSDIQLGEAQKHLQEWLSKGYQADMGYMSKHGLKRSKPESLIPGTLSILSVRLDYLPPVSRYAQNLKAPTSATVAQYALGRDYHKVMRKRLQNLADKIERDIGPFGYRVFSDSAPVLERAIAEKAGLGWIGKNTNLINRHAGSWFFLGEIYTDLPFRPSQPTSAHCGSCTACLDICPTAAIVAPYQLDARRCISYLTIENKGSIPTEFRKAIGNRIYGCDDCQLVCPWNRYAKPTQELDFLSRHQLDKLNLIEAFLWTEETFLQKTEGSAIRRIGYKAWLRNIAVALGNAPSNPVLIEALQYRRHDDSDMVKEHVAWALQQHGHH